MRITYHVVAFCSAPDRCPRCGGPGMPPRARAFMRREELICALKDTITGSRVETNEHDAQ